MPNSSHSHPSRFLSNHTPSTLKSPPSEASPSNRPRLTTGNDGGPSNSTGQIDRDSGNTTVTDNTITESNPGHRESENEDDDWVDWDIFSGIDNSCEDTCGQYREETQKVYSGDTIDERRNEEYEVRARETGRKEMQMVKIVTNKQGKEVSHVRDEEGDDKSRQKRDPPEDENHWKNRTSTKKTQGRAYPRPLSTAAIEARKCYAELELMKEERERSKKN